MCKSHENKMDMDEPEIEFSSERSNLLGKKKERRCSSCSGGIHDELSQHGSLAESLNDSKENSIQDKHCHEMKTRPDIDKRARRKLIIACVLSLTFMIAEVIGGIYAHSLAIVSDAAHLLTDLASFLISLLAIYLASRRATTKLSFGWYRAEILGALMSILFLWVVTGVLCYMAVERVVNQTFEVDATIMLITASCGVAFNIIMGSTLHPGGHGHSHGGSDSNNSNHGNQYDVDEEKMHLSHSESTQPQGHSSYGTVNESQANHTSEDTGLSHGGEGHAHIDPGHSHHANINVKAAFIHVLGDLLQSIGVLVAAIIIYFRPEWKLADPICTFLFSVIVLVTTLTIMKEILVVLMEGTPRGIDFHEIQRNLKNIREVEDLHDLRIWSLSLNKVAMSVHIAVNRSSDTLLVLQKASTMVQQKFGITETTIQVEEYVDDMLDCTHCKDLPS